MHPITVALTLLAGQAFAQEPGESDKIVVGHFSARDLSAWEEKVFERQTTYLLTELDNQLVLKAQSNDSASGLFKKMSVDIKRYPYLHWSWRVDQRLPPVDETKKAGDDYAARIYVVVSGGVWFWQTRALNYVWSGGAEREAVWPNAFAPNNARMVAVRTAADQLGTWHHEQRNIYRDLQQWYIEAGLGDAVETIDAIAIMTDTDNTHGQASAFYGDIYFCASKDCPVTPLLSSPIK